MIPVTTRDRVFKVIAETQGLHSNDLMEDMSLSKDLQLDSLDLIDMCFELEKEFDLHDLYEDFKDVQSDTIGLVVRLIEKKVTAKDAAA